MSYRLQFSNLRDRNERQMQFSTLSGENLHWTCSSRVYCVIRMSTTVECSLWWLVATGSESKRTLGGVHRALRYTKIVDTFQKSRRSRKIPIALRAVLS